MSSQAQPHEREGGRAHTLSTAVATPIAIPAPIPGAAKNAIPLPSVPSSPPPMAATIAPTAAYLAYRINRLMAYRITYLARQPYHIPHA